MSSDADRLRWETGAQRFVPGQDVFGTVDRVWKVGAQIRLDENVSALLLNAELAWDRQVEDARELLTLGTVVPVQILEAEPWRQRIIVSLRRAQEDPWVKHSREYATGCLVRGRVVEIARGEVIVEFQDHVRGFIPRSEVVAWQCRVEDILEVGDSIQALVIDRDERSRHVQVSMKARLAQLDSEIAAALDQPQAALAFGVLSESHSADTDEAPGLAEPEDAAGLPAAEYRILVVEPEVDQRLQLCAILYELGFKHVVEASMTAAGIEIAKQERFDLVLLEQDMAGGCGEAGVKAALAIKAAVPEAKVVIVSGNRPVWGVQPPEELSGMIAKPFSLGDVSDAIRRLRDVGTAGWPDFAEFQSTGPLTGDSERLIENISRTAYAFRPLGDTLHSIVADLTAATDASAGAVFSFSRQTQQVEMQAAVNIEQSDFMACKANLNKSPISDLVDQSRRPIFFNDIQSEAASKFRYLYPILGVDGRGWALRSAIGEVAGSQRDTAYSLFLLGKRTFQFHAEHRVLAHAAAMVVAAVIREHWMFREVAAERRLTAMGTLLTSAAHEMRGRLSALEAASRAAGIWQRMKGSRDQAEYDKLSAELEKQLAALVAGKKAADAVLNRVLSWTRTAGPSVVSVSECIRRAIEVCEDAAAKAHWRIIFEAESVPPVFGNPVELEQVFLNLVLNALQHSGGTRRRCGLLDIRLTHPSSHGPIAIRFRDTGPGIHSRHISPSVYDQERIFEPLYTTKPSGTGMGLYIVRELLAKHGGTIHVETTEILAGTTFLIELPIWRAIDNEHKPEKATNPRC